MKLFTITIHDVHTYSMYVKDIVERLEAQGILYVDFGLCIHVTLNGTDWKFYEQEVVITTQSLDQCRNEIFTIHDFIRLGHFNLSMEG